jgi:hypothetical protein
MTIPVWPSELPQRFQREGYSEQSQDGRLFTRTSAGPPKTRRKYSRVLQTVPASIVVGYDGKSRLERFVREETVQGSLPFIAPDQSHDAVALGDELGAELIDESGAVLIDTATWLVMFAENELPKYDPDGLKWRASFTRTGLP